MLPAGRRQLQAGSLCSPEGSCAVKTPGSARVSRVGFGVSPKQSFQKSPRLRDAIGPRRTGICTRGARATLCMSVNSAGALRRMKIFVAISLALTTSLLGQTPAPGGPGGKRAFTFEDMMKLKRVGAPVPSLDGKWVLFDCEDVDLEANTKVSHLWIVPAQGGESRRLNATPNHEERPRFSPDGRWLIWTSKATDPTQIWMCDFDPSAGALVGQPHQVTNISTGATGADGAIWSPDAKNIVFVSAVYPDCKDDACNKQHDEELKNSKVKAKIFHATLLSALERVHRVQTQSFVRSICRGRRVACTIFRNAADTAAATEEWQRAP